MATLTTSQRQNLVTKLCTEWMYRLQLRAVLHPSASSHSPVQTRMIICILRANSVVLMIQMKSVFPVYAPLSSGAFLFHHDSGSLLLIPSSYLDIKTFPLASLVSRLLLWSSCSSSPFLKAYVWVPKLSSRHFLCLWYSQRTQPLVPPQPSRSLCKHLMRSTTFAPGRPVVIWDHSPSCHGNRKGTSSSKKMKGELAQTEEEVLRGGRKCHRSQQALWDASWTEVTCWKSWSKKESERKL